MNLRAPVARLERAMRFYSLVFGVPFGELVTLHGSRMAHLPFEAGLNLSPEKCLPVFGYSFPQSSIPTYPGTSPTRLIHARIAG